ncbi:glutamyl-tRNA reductase [Candidatus Enterovibrio escicola]|uniref:Glutamyl-tRNA reductase n=1 Tax=Candidatus Enterovibrio escicola TaxID=1927127 RepID=A0A2A5SZN2_9GAMM|nr:glutamyl-tRNA reductase [Candidatus Enterovibrio escacola]PCS21377.1 Glutamyl-tRNA reductase [Candidatus Enterovibrio escacola]
MSLLVLGINHNTAPVHLREKVAFSPQQVHDALNQLKQRQVVQSGVIVSTCNRTEIYCELVQPTSSVVVDWLRQFHNIDRDILLRCLYTYHDQAAAQHLMRVASGLDSLVLGEPQIFGQVKNAYAESVELEAVSGLLERLFHKTFTVAKRVRTETDIGGNAVSIAFAACSLARQIFESLKSTTVLLVGAGNTIELVAKHLYEHECRQIIVANRTRKRAKLLAEAVGAETIALEEIPEYIHRADIVISSTAALLPIIDKGIVEKALKVRRHQPMLLIDIAVPRDIEEGVGELNDAYLYTIDDLHSIVKRNREQRKNAAVQAEAIIDEESKEFMIWMCSRDAVNSIKQYRAHSQALKNEVLSRSLQALDSGSDPKRVLKELSNKLTNKLIHAPTQAMQKAARNGDECMLDMLRQSLGLDPKK